MCNVSLSVGPENINSLPIDLILPGTAGTAGDDEVAGIATVPRFTVPFKLLIPATVKLLFAVTAPCKLLVPTTVKLLFAVTAPCKLLIPATVKLLFAVTAPCKVLVPTTVNVPLTSTFPSQNLVSISSY